MSISIDEGRIGERVPTMDLDFFKQLPEGPFVLLEKVRACGRVVWNGQHNAWMVPGYDDIKKVETDLDHFTSEGSGMAEAFGPQAMLVQDGPLHTALRNVWAQPFMAKTLETYRTGIRDIVQRVSRPVIDQLKAGETVDLCGLFQSYVGAVITWLTDVPEAYGPQFIRWNNVLAEYSLLSFAPDHPHALERAKVKRDLYAFLEAELLRKQQERSDKQDVVSLMAAAEGLHGITRQVIVDNLLNLILGAVDTSTKWMGNSFVLLNRHPDVLKDVIEDRALLPQALDEVMRFHTVVQSTVRVVRCEVADFGGQRLRKGDNVFILNGAANRDPAAFAQPDVFDIRRSLKMHLGFGYGIHRCLGVNLARLENVELLNLFLDDVPDLRIVEADYGTSWQLWGPRKLLVSLSK